MVRPSAIFIALAWCGVVSGQSVPAEEADALSWHVALPLEAEPELEAVPPRPGAEQLQDADGTWPAGSWPFSPQVAGPRTYVSAVVGSDFTTLTTLGSLEAIPGNTFTSSGTVNASVLTGGGAIGLALPRPAGQLRMEVEGRARGSFNGPTSLAQVGPGTDIQLPLRVTLQDGWSTLANFWRDVLVTDAIGVYLGGGFGAGGYRYQVRGGDALLPVLGPAVGRDTITTFAWQAGTGVVWDVSDRITLDVGYRFFSYGPGSTPLTSDNGAGISYLGNASSACSASELIFSVRVYEPLRGILR